MPRQKQQPNTLHDPLARSPRPTSVQHQETNVEVNRDLWGGVIDANKPLAPAEPSPPEFGSLAIPQTDQDLLREAYGKVRDFNPPQESDFERNFRHSGWYATRIKVGDSMDRVNVSMARRIRFRCCGSNCIIERSPSEKRIRVRACFCHDRWCLPCGRSRSATICSNISKIVAGKETRFITLTLKHNDGPLDLQLKRLLLCFRNLRQGVLWKNQVDGGCVFLELKRSRNKRSWHPHLHIITEGRYIAQNALSENWLAVTGDSRIVDIRFVRDSQSVLNYVAKYASKPMDHSLFERQEWIDEAMLAMRGKRLCSTFGSWRGKELEAHAPDPGDWMPVCSLNQLSEALEREEAWAVAMWTQLRRKTHEEIPMHPTILESS